MTDPSPECKLCDLAADGHGPPEGWILRNALVSAYENGSNIPGWYQLQVNRHAADFGQLTEDEAEAIGAAARAIGKAVTSVTGASRLYSYSMCEFMPHFHMVIGAAPEVDETVPRGSPLLSRIMTRDLELQDAPRATQVADEVRRALSR